MIVLTGQLQLATIPLGQEVVVEKVGVETSLNDARDPTDPIAVARLDNETPDPVQNVETAIGAERDDVGGVHGLDLASALNEEELGENGDGLEVDGEGPEELVDGEIVVEEKRKNGRGNDEKEHAERVVLFVVRVLVLDAHQIDGGDGGGEKNHLHDRVVQ